MPATGDLDPRAAASHRLRLLEKAHDIDGVSLHLDRSALRSPAPGEVVVKVEAAAVNPSDIKAATGLMPYAIFPRTPGRDFAGRIVEGPPSLVGARVFGSSGDLGIRIDGTHATHLLVEADALVNVPDGVSLDEAAGLGVPFVTAAEGYRRAGEPQPGEIVLVMGANGKVGQAAVQIAAWRGSRVIGVVRNGEGYSGHARTPIEVVDASSCEVAARVRDLTDGHGADIVFNTVGDPYYQDATKALAVLGRQILISAVNRIASLDILAFYKGRHTYVGVDTISLGSIESGERLRTLAPGFVSGALRPFPIEPHAIYPLEQAIEAYRAVIGGTRDRVILKPSRT